MGTNQTQPLNRVETVFSEKAITHLECLVHWYWDWVSDGQVTKYLMKMLEVYTKANPTEKHYTPADMVGRVSEWLQLHEQLAEIVEYETAWAWVDTPKGFEKPV